MSGKHPKRDRGVDPGEPTAASRAEPREVSAAGLRAQMAILAEQVRQLGHHVDHAADSQPAGATDAPPPAPPALHHSATVDPTPEPERAQPDPPQPVASTTVASPPYTRDTVTDDSRHLFESVIAAAERAALEIRASAERQAASIRARASDDRVAPTADLASTGVRQRQTLAALAAETDRIAQAVAVLGAQIRALDAKRWRSYEARDADPQTP
jgi:hypothetical protein